MMRASLHDAGAVRPITSAAQRPLVSGRGCYRRGDPCTTWRSPEALHPVTSIYLTLVDWRCRHSLAKGSTTGSPEMTAAVGAENFTGKNAPLAECNGGRAL